MSVHSSSRASPERDGRDPQRLSELTSLDECSQLVARARGAVTLGEHAAPGSSRPSASTAGESEEPSRGGVPGEHLRGPGSQTRAANGASLEEPPEEARQRRAVRASRRARRIAMRRRLRSATQLERALEGGAVLVGSRGSAASTSRSSARERRARARGPSGGAARRSRRRRGCMVRRFATGAGSGSGLAMRNPWTKSAPRARAHWSSCGVSTPSTMVLDAEAVADLEELARDEVLHPVLVHLADELAIELDEVGPQPVDEVERGPARAEIVERDAEAVAPVAIEHGLEVGGVLDAIGLDHLEHEPLGLEPRRVDGRHGGPERALRVVHHRRREVDEDGDAGSRWAASRMAQRQAARSSSWNRPASRAFCRMASGSSGSPFRPLPRSSASCAKTREVSPTWTIGWKWLVIRPPRTARGASRSGRPRGAGAARRCGRSRPARGPRRRRRTARAPGGLSASGQRRAEVEDAGVQLARTEPHPRAAP